MKAFLKAKKFTFISLIPLATSIIYAIFSFLFLLPFIYTTNADNDWVFFMGLLATVNLEYSHFAFVGFNIASIILQAKALKRKEILWLNILLLALSIILIILAIGLFVFMILLIRGV